MKLIKNYYQFYTLIREAKNYSSKNLISEICVIMVLLNNEFLDNILDRGLRARYTNDSHTFITDLKNLLMAKNRLKFGKFIEDDICIEDSDISKALNIFDETEFNIETDWKLLTDARTTARSIIDKLLPDGKLESQMIKNIFWIGPNKDGVNNEDIVIELNNGKQYSFYLNKNLSNKKTASFNKLGDELIGEDMNYLYSDAYIPRWDKLTQSWVKIIYENANNNIQAYIEEFINPDRIDTITYYDYYDVEINDSSAKYIGKYIKEFDRNIIKFSDLMSEIWKHRDICFIDTETIEKQWYETKVIVLNSKILENIFSTSLKNNYRENITKLDNGMKKADGALKMRLIKILVEKMDALERNVYYISKNGLNFHTIPSRDFFREYFDNMELQFDYHVPLIIKEEEEDNEFNIKIDLILDDELLINMNIKVKFSGGEMSGKLSAQYNFNLSPRFNSIVSEKMMLN